MSSANRHRRVAWVAGISVAAVVGVATFQPSARADTPLATFSALAAANGLSIQLSNDSIPVAPTPEMSGPIAQASLDPLGTSLAYASFPYPGDTLSASPKLVGGVFGVPAPAYPLIVSTSTIPSTQTGGTAGIALRSDSQANESQASSVVGDGNGVGSASLAQVVNNSGSGQGLTATASTESSLSRVGGVFALKGVSSSASATSDGNGVVKTLSNLQFADLYVPGLAVEIPAATPGSVPIPVPIPGAPQLPAQQFPAIPIPAPFGGSTIPAPHIGFENGYFTLSLPQLANRVLVPASAVLAGLKAMGIDATYEAPTPIVQNGKTVGIIGAGLMLTTNLPAPPQNQVFNGPTKVAITIGRSVASLRDVSAGSAPTASLGTSSGSVGPGLAAGGGAVNASPGSVGTAGSAAQSGGGLPVDVTKLGTTGDASPAQVPRTSNFVPTRRLSGVAPVGASRDTLDIYLALVGVALLGSMAPATIRLLGVRVP